MRTIILLMIFFQLSEMSFNIKNKKIAIAPTQEQVNIAVKNLLRDIGESQISMEQLEKIGL